MIVDTSVAIKWFVPEEDDDLAARLIGAGAIAPDLLLAELGNALWKKCRQRQIDAQQATAAIAAVPSYVAIVPSAPLASEALAIALELSHPVYDCFFLALAQRSGRTLVTCDLRLLSRCQPTSFASIVTDLKQLSSTG